MISDQTLPSILIDAALNVIHAIVVHNNIVYGLTYPYFKRYTQELNKAYNKHKSFNLAWEYKINRVFYCLNISILARKGARVDGLVTIFWIVFFIDSYDAQRQIKQTVALLCAGASIA
jgi:hypothetical protein